MEFMSVYDLWKIAIKFVRWKCVLGYVCVHVWMSIVQFKWFGYNNGIDEGKRSDSYMFIDFEISFSFLSRWTEFGE